MPVFKREVLDAHRSLGHVVATRAVELGVAQAREMKDSAGRPTRDPSAFLEALHLSLPTAAAGTVP